MRLLPCWLRAALPVLVVCALLVPGSVRAADPPPEYYDGGLFDWHAHIFFWVNRQVFWVINHVSDWLAGARPDTTIAKSGVTPPRSALERGVGNVAANLVNEPVTAVTNVVIGDFSTAWTAVKRFSINSTIGMLGWYDAAKALGLPPTVTDVGLILCKAGVGEGAYVVLPFIGPRTLRDGLSDMVLTNAILWTLTGAVLGTGASLQTIIIAETIEVAADLLATRQIDPNAKVSHFDDFKAVRKAYLEQRRARCDALRAPEQQLANQ